MLYNARRSFTTGENQYVTYLRRVEAQTKMFPPAFWALPKGVRQRPNTTPELWWIAGKF
jgi:hypothetical protein